MFQIVLSFAMYSSAFYIPTSSPLADLPEAVSSLSLCSDLLLFSPSPSDSSLAVTASVSGTASTMSLGSQSSLSLSSSYSEESLRLQVNYLGMHSF